MDRDRVALDLVALTTILAIGVALGHLATGDAGFTRAGVVDGVAGQLPVTLPAAIVMACALAVDLGAGLVLARLALGRPFDDIAEAALAAFVAAVLLDVALLGVLGQVGLFNQPVILAVVLPIVALGGVRARPLMRAGASGSWGSPSALGALVVITWSGAVVLQLASPVVPFMDVLPNHVAPAEHLRTFGSLTPLTATSSPIYGPSRSLLGYTAFLGTVTTLSGLPASLAASTFILPSLLLVAAGIVRLGAAIAGRGIAPWVLLTFALTPSFTRLGDARGTVVVLPLLCWALAIVADRLRDPSGTAPAVTSVARPARAGDGLLVGAGLGAALLVHPVLGFLAVATLVVLVVARPERVAAFGIPAVAAGAVVALPQAATMIGVSLPAVVTFGVIPVAALVGVALERWVAIHRPIVLVARLGLLLLVPVVAIGAYPVAVAVRDVLGPIFGSSVLGLLVVLLGVAARTPALRSPVLAGALLVGLLVGTIVMLIPSGSAGMLGTSLRFELLKTLQYWVPVFVAIAAATSLQRLWVHGGIRLAARVPIVVAVLLAAVLPLGDTEIGGLHLVEHSVSETLATDLHHAANGYWQGYPDPRNIVDAPRRELLDAVRTEIATGRLQADTPVLHIAASFQQWKATPLGVFTGVTETDVSPDAEVSIHTVGGRLHPMEDLDALVASRSYPYLLLEPHDLPAGIREAIVATGYRPVYANEQGELFALAWAAGG